VVLITEPNAKLAQFVMVLVLAKLATSLTNANLVPVKKLNQGVLTENAAQSMVLQELVSKGFTNVAL